MHQTYEWKNYLLSIGKCWPSSYASDQRTSLCPLQHRQISVWSSSTNFIATQVFNKTSGPLCVTYYTNVNAAVADSLRCRMICGTVLSSVHAWWVKWVSEWAVHIWRVTLKRSLDGQLTALVPGNQTQTCVPINVHNCTLQYTAQNSSANRRRHPRHYHHSSDAVYGKSCSCDDNSPNATEVK